MWPAKPSVTPLASALILASVFVYGCSPKEGASNSSLLAQTPPPSSQMAFEAILAKCDQIPEDELRAQLAGIYNSWGPPSQVKQKSAYMLARLLQKSGQAEDQRAALKLFEESRNYPPLWQRSQWHIADLAAQLGGEKQVRSVLQELRARTTDPSELAAIDYAFAQSLLRAHESAKARDAFIAIRQQFPESQFAIGSAYYLAEILLQSQPQAMTEALALFREYLERSPDGHFAQTIVERLLALPGFRPSEKDRHLFGQVYFAQSNWEMALTQWKGGASDKNWYEVAVCEARLGHTAKAKQLLQQGIHSHPSSKSVVPAAEMLSRLSTREKAMAVWQTILASNRHTDVALWNLAIRSQPPQALAYYKLIASRFPQSSYAPEASWKLVFDMLKHNDLKGALARAQFVVARYPSSKAAPRCAFWRGKIFERLKQTSKAKAAYQQAASLYPANYYGHRAKSRLSALSGGRDWGWLTVPNRPHPSPNWMTPPLVSLANPQELVRECGPALTALMEICQWDESLQLLPPSADPALKGWLLGRAGLPLDSINTASQDLAGPPRGDGKWQTAYPLLYSAYIARAASTRHIDPLLVHALIREESRYNNLALSRSNAIGLMQLLPATAYGVAKRIGVKLNDRQDIFEPANNIQLGTAYLSYTLSRFSKNALLAVASYNGGPNAVQFWLRKLPYLNNDYDAFIEDIPYAETRDYVRKVFASLWNYQMIYK